MPSFRCGSADNGCREKERKTRRSFPVEMQEARGGDGDSAARNAGNNRQSLRHADCDSVEQIHLI